MTTTPAIATVQRDILLVRYKENAEQARHHEQLRERSTSMVAATTGVLLGLTSLKDGSPFTPLAGAFIILLGLWGVYSSIAFENRARRHRARIGTILNQLGLDVEQSTSHTFYLVWVAFHIGIVALGVIVTRLH
jgi:hypothetical protein